MGLLKGQLSSTSLEHGLLVSTLSMTRKRVAATAAASLKTLHLVYRRHIRRLCVLRAFKPTTPRPTPLQKWSVLETPQLFETLRFLPLADVAKVEVRRLTNFADNDGIFATERVGTISNEAQHSHRECSVSNGKKRACWWMFAPSMWLKQGKIVGPSQLADAGRYQSQHKGSASELMMISWLNVI